MGLLCLTVIRRVGGLEDYGKRSDQRDGVIRRVGGLEVLILEDTAELQVIRRVGGLEDKHNA